MSFTQIYRSQNSPFHQNFDLSFGRELNVRFPTSLLDCSYLSQGHSENITVHPDFNTQNTPKLETSKNTGAHLARSSCGDQLRTAPGRLAFLPDFEQDNKLSWQFGAIPLASLRTPPPPGSIPQKSHLILPCQAWPSCLQATLPRRVRYPLLDHSFATIRYLWNCIEGQIGIYIRRSRRHLLNIYLNGFGPSYIEIWQSLGAFMLLRPMYIFDPPFAPHHGTERTTATRIDHCNRFQNTIERNLWSSFLMP